MPSTKVFPWLISKATNSVGLIRPELNSEKCIPLDNNLADKSSALLIFATVTSAKRPKWEFISNGWASVSLMTPMPALPQNLPNSSSNFVRK